MAAPLGGVIKRNAVLPASVTARLHAERTLKTKKAATVEVAAFFLRRSERL